MDDAQTMTMPHATLAMHAIEEAITWHVKLHAETADEADHAAFEAWKRKHPDNAEAYHRLDALWSKFDGVQAAPAIAALEAAFKSHPRKSRTAKTAKAMFGLALIVIGAAAAKTETAGYLMADHSTGVGEQRVIDLADNSRIILNTYSAIDVDFDGEQRLITLHKGEILVEVAKDRARPFIVKTGQGTARALGTSFVVRRDGDATTVSVVESVVEACAATPLFSDAKPRCTRLQAGQATRMADNQVEQARSVDIDAVSGWSGGMLAVDNRPLAEVLNELERYRYGRIHYDDAVGKLRVSGVFPLHDTERTLEALSGIVPIQVEQYTPLLTVVSVQ